MRDPNRIEIIECCTNCKHCIPCKQLIDYKWHWYYICDLFAHEKDGWALYLGENPSGNADLCECYEVRLNDKKIIRKI